MTYLQDATHSSGLVGAFSSGASQIIYVMPWNQSHEDANILLVRRNPSELVDTIAGLDIQHLTSNVMGLFQAKATTLDQEISTTTNTEKGNFYKTAIQSWLRREALEEFAVQIQWEGHWDWSQVFQQREPGFVNIDTLESYRFFDVTTRLNTAAVFPSGRFITANIEQEDSDKTSAVYWHRREILDRFNVLAQREDNWDGYESKKPNQLTLDHAKFIILDFLDTVISAEYSWITPFISSDEDGCVTVEWYEGERELHIQIGENEAEYLQMWGTNIDTDMDEGFLNRDNYLALWEWLFHV